MSTATLDNSRISKHLGQTSEYKDQYDSSLLVNEPRSNNRKHLDISDDDLPFVGYDTWNAYEVSGLTNNGLPVAGVAKVVYPSDSKYIVESKSIKLYFNSFNMYKCGDQPVDVLDFIDQKATEDLSALLETTVHVHTTPANFIAKGESVLDRYKYNTLECMYTQEELSEMTLDVYSESPELLELEDISGKAVESTETLLVLVKSQNECLKSLRLSLTLCDRLLSTNLRSWTSSYWLMS